MSGPIASTASNLEQGHMTAEGLVEECLECITDPMGEGARAFVHFDAPQARATARAVDLLRGHRAEPSPLAGIPVSVKDLFDVRGEVTRAGSRVMCGTPARDDSAAVARFRRAGLVLIGRTNMTEFAYSGLGVNPHYGTPKNPWDRNRGRIPGGSSSGAAVSVYDGMAHGALGSDTGGSCRIPAALCGLVGFKPTQSSISRRGMVPLSPTLDSVGVIARTVSCCALLYAVLTDRALRPPEPVASPPRLAVVRGYFIEEAEPFVVTAFDRAISTLSCAGADIHEVTLPELDALPEMNAGGGFPAAEAFAWHRDLIGDREADYDPRVLTRIRRGAMQTAADLLELHERRAALIAGMRERLRDVDGFLFPTVPLVAPPLDALDDDAEYGRVNLLMLRNSTVVNLIDGCAISVPMHREGEPPTGLTVAGPRDADESVLRVAAWIEEQL